MIHQPLLIISVLPCIKGFASLNLVKKAKAMPDFRDDEYKHMLCVEAATVENPITLKRREKWKGRQQILVVPSGPYAMEDVLEFNRIWAIFVNDPSYVVSRFIHCFFSPFCSEAERIYGTVGTKKFVKIIEKECHSVGILLLWYATFYKNIVIMM
ncbi:hypothetical protein LXL04_039281 [Taraxacum kok-saghyz]